MNKIVEYVSVLLIIYSLIELLSIVLSTFVYSYSSLTDAEALLNSKIIILQVFISFLAAYVYNKRLKK